MSPNLITSLLIYQALQWFVIDETANIFYSKSNIVFNETITPWGNVGRDNHVRQRPQRTIFRQRFDYSCVQTRASEVTSLGESYMMFNTMGRDVLWPIIYEHAMQRPLVGWGPGRARMRLADNDIRDRNPTYYRSRVSRSASVKRCQRKVASESRRRAQARKTAAKKSKEKANAGKAAPKKRAKPKQAAPDDAAETKSSF